MKRTGEPRIRKSPQARKLAALRTARNKAAKLGDQAEVDRLESELGRLTGMNV
jgi:hypothetical protein